MTVASQTFQDEPRPLYLAWVRAENAELLSGLAVIEDPVERGRIFHDYALTRFWLHEDRASWPEARELLRRSYVSVLRGWTHDSNGPSGAMLKAWAVQRFGLRPIWHGERLRGEDDERLHAARFRAQIEGIAMQLDLLYTWCQDELARRHPGERWLTLYRGTHDPEAYLVKEAAAAGTLVEFNAVSSFTSDREIAWEFGSQVWRVRVPLAKILLAPRLLPTGLLTSESEYLVLGGDYLVETLRW